MRTFEKTHPWIRFRADLRTAPPLFWVLLGEAQSKCQHIAGVPLRPATAEELNRLFLAKGALATTAIEGNTLTEEEVLKHLDGELKLPPSRQYLAREIDNIVGACNAIVENTVTVTPTLLTPTEIEGFNRKILEGLALKRKLCRAKFANML